MSRTIINVLEELGLAVDLSLLKETRGIHIYGKTVFFGHDHLDVSAAVFYKCSLVSDTLVDALLIDCSYEISIPKDLGILCGKAHPKISFSGVDFLGANLQDVNLYGADLQGANLEDAKLKGAFYNNNTAGLTEEQKAVMIETSEDASEDASNY